MKSKKPNWKIAIYVAYWWCVEHLLLAVTSFIASQLKLLFLLLNQNYNSFPDLSSDAKLNDDVDDDDDDVEGLAAAVPRHEALPRPAWWDPYLHLFLSLQKNN